MQITHIPSINACKRFISIIKTKFKFIGFQMEMHPSIKAFRELITKRSRVELQIAKDLTAKEKDQIIIVEKFKRKIKYKSPTMEGINPELIIRSSKEWKESIQTRKGGSNHAINIQPKSGQNQTRLCGVSAAQHIQSAAISPPKHRSASPNFVQSCLDTCTFQCYT